MKTIINRDSRIHLALLCLLLGAAVVVPARAAVPGAVTAVYFFDVPPRLEPAFVWGWKRIIACVKSHHAKFTAVVYSKLENRGRYVVLEPYRTWAELEKHGHDPDEAPCLASGLWQRDIQPNFTKATGEFAQINPRVSYMTDGDPYPPRILWVRAYRVKPEQRVNFIESQERIAAAAAKIHSDVNFTGYDIYGAGVGGPTFVYISPVNSMSQIGHSIDFPIEQIGESMYGKAAVGADRQKLADSLADEWSEVWVYRKDLSYVPAL